MRGSGVRFPLPAYQSMTYERSIRMGSASFVDVRTQSCSQRSSYVCACRDAPVSRYPIVYPVIPVAEVNGRPATSTSASAQRDCSRGSRKNQPNERLGLQARGSPPVQAPPVSAALSTMPSQGNSVSWWLPWSSTPHAWFHAARMRHGLRAPGGQARALVSPIRLDPGCSNPRACAGPCGR